MAVLRLSFGIRSSIAFSDFDPFFFRGHFFFDDNFDDIDFEDSGATIDVSSTNTTTYDQ
jgi:hypothetical protein